MKKWHIPVLVCCLLIISAMLPAGCGPGGETGNRRILRVCIDTDIMNLSPGFIDSISDETVSRAVFEGLIRYTGGSAETENLLAEWIKTSEDDRVIHFKLREGVMWHKDYGELTTEDVKFSYERFLDPELAAPYADDWAALDHVEIIDDYEGKIVLKEAQATVWTTTLPLTSGVIVCKKQVEEIGNEKFSTDIVGTGPYVFDEWKPNEKVILKRNQEYWGEMPYWEEIHLIPIEETAASEIALESGEVDFGLINLGSAERFEDDPDFGVMMLPTSSFGWLGMNIENPKLQDINVRQAIRYAIDVPAILEATYLGKVEQAKSLIPSYILGHWDEAPLYERDLEKARSYLTKAGVTSLDLELAVENTMEFRTWAEIIKENLADIGINVNIQVLDSSTFWVIGDGDQGKEVEMFALIYMAAPDPSWFTMWFTSDQVGVWNWMRWSSPEFDALHKEGILTLDPEKRKSIYIEMQKLWDEAVHSVWIRHDAQIYGHSKKIVPAMFPAEGVPMLREFKLAE